MIPANSFAEPSTKTGNDFSEGTIEWISRCFMIGSPITVRVTDYDMNNDPNKIEQFNVKVWSDYDLESDFEDRIIDYAVTETGANTGVFDSSVFLTTTDDSPGKRIRVIDNSTVFAKYVDYTVPHYVSSDVIGIFTVTGLSVLERTDDSRMSKITYDPCAIVLFEKNKEKFNELDIFYPAPLKQIKSGLHIDEIQCKDNLVLIKKNNGYRYCVNPETVPSLHERGWATKANLAGESSRMCYVEYDPGSCEAAIEKYYFDGGSGTCKSFTWGGCDGKVPFDTMGMCQGLCGVNNEN